MRKYSTIRSFDVCTTKEWTKLGDMPYRSFALQTGASSSLNLAFTCGGQVHHSVDAHGNSGWCVATRLPDGMTLVENRATKATREQIAGSVLRSSSSYL
jgi:hypothetical protein